MPHGLSCVTSSTPLSETRVVTAESFGKAAEGSMKVSETGVVSEVAGSKEATVDGGARVSEITEQCFHPETLVLIYVTDETWPLIGPWIHGRRRDDGPNRLYHCEIQHLKPGVHVLSRCEKTGEMGYKRIREVFHHEAEYPVKGDRYDENWYDVYGISYEFPDRLREYPESHYGYGNGDVYVTGEHRFWVESKGWVPARNLQEGDVLLSHNREAAGEFARVTSARLSDKIPDVYNLSVEDFNTYFVTGHGIWVHNTKATPVRTELLPIINQAARPKLAAG